MKHWKIIVVGLICLLIGGMIGNVWPVNQLTASSNQATNQPRRPLIFVPGSGGTQESYNRMLQTLNRNKQHSILKITVADNGDLKVTGNLKSADKKPLMVVAFVNNADGDQNIARQTALFKTTLRQLEKRYHFKQFDGVGYSNGGLVLTQFAEQDSHRTALKRLMTIGTPYNDLNPKASQKSAMLKSLLADRKKLSKQLTVFSLGNIVEGDSDGIVPISSVLAGRQIFTNQVAHFTTLMTNDPQAAHTELIDNQTIIWFVKRVMINRETPI